jgi:hypothetical protein
MKAILVAILVALSPIGAAAATVRDFTPSPIEKEMFFKYRAPSPHCRVAVRLLSPQTRAAAIAEVTALEECEGATIDGSKTNIYRVVASNGVQESSRYAWDMEWLTCNKLIERWGDTSKHHASVCDWWYRERYLPPNTPDLVDHNLGGPLTPLPIETPYPLETSQPVAVTDPALCNRPATVLHAVAPDTPAAAAQQGIVGIVTINVTLNEKSEIVAAVVADSPSALLNNAALTAARATAFRTGYVNCRAVGNTFGFLVEFGSRP